MIEIHPSRTNMYQGEVLAYHAEVSPRGWVGFLTETETETGGKRKRATGQGVMVAREFY